MNEPAVPFDLLVTFFVIVLALTLLALVVGILISNVQDLRLGQALREIEGSRERAWQTVEMRRTEIEWQTWVGKNPLPPAGPKPAPPPNPPAAARRNVIELRRPL